jgi:hypothetical protein
VLAGARSAIKPKPTHAAPREFEQLSQLAKVTGDVHIKWNVSHDQAVTVAQLTVAADRSIVDERSILTAQIPDANIPVQLVDEDLAVMPTDELFGDPNVAIGGTPDQEFRFDEQVLRRFDDEGIAANAVGPFENDFHVGSRNGSFRRSS